MVTNEQLGAGIARERKRRGLTQAELARRLDVTRASVANWETGVMAPRFRTVALIAETLGCGLDDFVGQGASRRLGGRGEAPGEAPAGARGEV